jgi:hypothetical protein
MYLEISSIVVIALYLYIAVRAGAHRLESDIIVMHSEQLPFRAGPGPHTNIAKRAVCAETRGPKRSPESTIDWSSTSPQ